MDNTYRETKTFIENKDYNVQNLIDVEEKLKIQYEELQRYSQNLEELQQKYNFAIKASNSGVWEVDIIDKTISLSDNIKKIIGYKKFENNNVYEVLKRIMIEEDIKKLFENYNRYMNGEREYIYSQIRIYDKKGAIKWFLVSGKGIKNKSGEIKKLYGIFTEITEIKKKEEKIKYMAYNDELTGLPNRSMFTKDMNKILNSNQNGVLMLIDLDNFKNVNDLKGHVYGDDILKKLGSAFKKMSNENITFYRFEGDEFLVLVKGEEDLKTISQYVKSINDTIKNETKYTSSGINITACMGIVFFPKDGDTINELLKKADTAMYKAKNEGKNKFLFFRDDMISSLKEKLEIEGKIKKALLNNGFKILYQPIVNAITGEVVSFEALLRLKDLSYPPSKFIPIAEESDLIISIGNFVFEQVAKQLQKWKTKGYKIKPVSINVSAKQFYEESFIYNIEKLIHKYELDTSLIEIEITERIMIENTQSVIEKIEELKKLGFSIILDDFGTGYSSLNYLTYLNVDKIKIDKSLIDRFLNDEKFKTIESIIMLIKSLNIEVTAEGIERLEQLQTLKRIGCNYIQGYLFSKPLPDEDIIKKFLN